MPFPTIALHGGGNTGTLDFDISRTLHHDGRPSSQPSLATEASEQQMSAADTSPSSWVLEAEGTDTCAEPTSRASQAWRQTEQIASRIPLATRLRLLILTGCAALALVQHAPLVLVGIAVVALTELAPPDAWRIATLAQAIAAATVVLTTTQQGSAAFPLLLVAAFRAGDLGLPRDVLGVVATTALTLLVGWQPLHHLAEASSPMVSDGIVWLGLAAGLGMLQCLSLRAARQHPSGSERAAHEAAYLVYRLRQLVRRLPNGLDAPDVAEELVDSVLAGVVADRAAVLVRRDGDLASPLVVRGSDRVPWRDPARSPGTPSVAWHSRRTVADVRVRDGDGRRLGSAMLCLPLLDADSELIGLLVLDRLTPTPFSSAEVAHAEETVSRLAPHLDAALMFSDLQIVATTAERERLAREMHDGIAQDLVALAFSLDALGRQLRKTSPDAAQSVAQVRAELTRMVSDIRYSISDLRTSVRPERGLGAVLSSQVQSIAASSRLTMHLSLHESTFRLPAQLETTLLRAAQSLLHDIRSDQTVSEIWLSLDVEPPRAELIMRHDGTAADHLDEDLARHLDQLGVVAVERPGELRLCTGPVERVATALVGEGLA
jgi:signal transduction histidine kinase